MKTLKDKAHTIFSIINLSQCSRFCILLNNGGLLE